MTTTHGNDKYSPSAEECLRMLEEYKTPDNVIGHCRAVSAVACAIGRAVNEKKPADSKLDLDLIRAAGLLHDIARVEDKHWDVAADYCLEKGMDREAEIIRVHMNYDPFNKPEDFNETDVVCLADRLVIEDRYAGLEARMDYVIAKAIRQGHEEYVPHIERRKKEVGILVEDLEEYLGKTMESICKNAD